MRLIFKGSTAAVMARSVHMPIYNQSPSGATPAPVVQPTTVGAQQENPVKAQRPFMDGDFEFVSIDIYHCRT